MDPSRNSISLSLITIKYYSHMKTFPGETLEIASSFSGLTAMMMGRNVAVVICAMA